MALDPDELAFLRQIISEPADSPTWPDSRFETIAAGALQDDGSYNHTLTAALLWEAKAADAVELVNTSESGSSRSMGQVFDHAVKMAERYRGNATSPATTAPAGLTSTRIIRPERGTR